MPDGWTVDEEGMLRYGLRSVGRSHIALALGWGWDASAEPFDSLVAAVRAAEKVQRYEALVREMAEDGGRGFCRWCASWHADPHLPDCPIARLVALTEDGDRG